MCTISGTCEDINSGRVRIVTELAPSHSVLGLGWQELMGPKYSLVLHSEFI